MGLAQSSGFWRDIGLKIWVHKLMSWILILIQKNRSRIQYESSLGELKEYGQRKANRASDWGGMFVGVINLKIMMLNKKQD